MRTLHTILGIRNTLHIRALLLASTWISGLLAGVYILRETSFSSMMYSVSFDRISIVGLLISLVFPLLLSYILLRCFHFYHILPLVFLKAFSFMCCYGSITMAFNNAGWLVSGMLLFSDYFLVILLLYLWFQASSEKCCSPQVSIISYILASITFGCFDYFVVSPYVLMLLNC